MTTRRTWLALAGLAVLGSQAGHLLTYQLRFGSTALQLQSSGAHVYFPAVVKTASGIAAAVAIGGLLTVGLARALAGQALAGRVLAPSFVRALAGLYTLQLAIFIAQELAEASAAGTPSPSPMVVLLWGALGQLPVAAAGALALRWLLIRFSAAALQLFVAIRALRLHPSPTTAVLTVAPSLSCEHPPQHGSVNLFHRRGPPLLPRFSLN